MHSRYRFGSKKYRSRKGDKKKKQVQKYKDTKGNWEYSIFQKIVKPHEEANIKKSLRFLGGFDPKKTKDYIEPPKSKEQLIQDKIDRGESINSGEKIIINNYNDKERKALEKDIASLNKFSLNANVSTSEGRKRKLLKSLEYLLKKKDDVMVSLISLKLKDDEFKLDDKLQNEYRDVLTKMNQVVQRSDLIKLQMQTKI